MSKASGRTIAVSADDDFNTRGASGAVEELLCRQMLATIRAIVARGLFTEEMLGPEALAKACAEAGVKSLPAGPVEMPPEFAATLARLEALFPDWTGAGARREIGARLSALAAGEPRDWIKASMFRALEAAEDGDDVARDALEIAPGAEKGALVGEWAKKMAEYAPQLLGDLFPDPDATDDNDPRKWADRFIAWLERVPALWAEPAELEAAELRALLAQEEIPGTEPRLVPTLLHPQDVLARMTWAWSVRAWWVARRKEEAPRFLAASLPLDLHKHVTRPPRALVAPGVDGWTLAPSLPAAVLDLPALSMSGGRAVLRQIPSVARGAALRDGEMVVLWENGAHRVTAEALTGMTTLLRAESAHSPNEALRAWLGLAHDADPWGALDLLTRLPLTWTTARGGSLNGPLVFEAKRIGGSATCQLSSALHPAVAGGMVGAVLVPVLPTLPPTWHPNAARLGDAFEHALMRELAMRAPGATEDGPLLDIDLVLAGESDGRLHERKGERLTFLRRLGLDGPDGCPGLWTGGVPGAERRWLVSNGRYLPADPDAAAMLKEGWAIRKGAVVGGRKSAAARKKRRGD